MQVVLKLYPDADIGPVVDTKLTYAKFMNITQPYKPDFSSQICGWKVQQVRKK